MPIRFASKPGLVAYLTAGDPDLPPRATSRSPPSTPAPT